MGASIPGSSSSGSRQVPSSLAEINVTPLVDVMLVLLIVFMISAPMMNQGVQVDLPKAKAGSLTDVPDQVILSVTKDKQVLVNATSVPMTNLRQKLEPMVNSKPDLQVYIQADQTVPYGFIAQVMAEVKNAKVGRVGLVTDPTTANQ